MNKRGDIQLLGSASRCNTSAHPLLRSVFLKGKHHPKRVAQSRKAIANIRKLCCRNLLTGLRRRERSTLWESCWVEERCRAVLGQVSETLGNCNFVARKGLTAPAHIVQDLLRPNHLVVRHS